MASSAYFTYKKLRGSIVISKYAGSPAGRNFPISHVVLTSPQLPYGYVTSLHRLSGVSSMSLLEIHDSPSHNMEQLQIFCKTVVGVAGVIVEASPNEQ
jgi:hypothetical protein